MKFLECVERKFLTQLAGKPSRDGAPLELLFTNRDMGDVVLRAHLGHSRHKMMKSF